MYCQTEEGWRIQQLKCDDQEKQDDNFDMYKDIWLWGFSFFS